MRLSGELIASYLDDTLTDEQAEELQAWLQADGENLREFAVAIARDQVIRTAVISQATLFSATACQPVAGILVGDRNSRLVLHARWAIAAGILVCAAWVWVPGRIWAPDRNSAATPTLVESSGRVTVQDDVGIANALHRGDVVRAGTLQVEGENARARFAYADGSEFVLTGTADVALPKGQRKELLLHHGVLKATVSPQRRNQPMVVRTLVAETTVLGTSFVISAAGTETLLHVTSGSVSFHRLSDNQAVTVSQDQQVRVEHLASEPLQPEAIELPPTHWKAASTRQRCEWLGDWQGNTLRAAPRIVFRKDYEVEETHFHAGARNGFPGLVVLQEGSMIRIRFRIERPLNLGLFISTQAPSWEFAGNFQAYVEERNTPPDADGWRTAAVPIEAFTPMARTAIPFQPGCIVATIYATTFGDDLGLEVAELEVVSKRK